ncbi:MAG: hypothetical protein QOH01_2570 [Verrucomicrobiota bacterium]
MTGSHPYYVRNRFSSDTKSPFLDHYIFRGDSHQYRDVLF